MKNGMKYTLAAIIAIVPFAFLLYIYPQLPGTVPTHFGLDGKPDDYSSKDTLFLAVGMLSLVGLGSFLLLLNIHKIDPKKKNNSPAVMAKFAFAVLIMMSLIQILILQSAQTGSIGFDKFLLPLLGLFFTFLGNLFYSLKPNYFVGMRTPWALEDDNNWRRTHQLAGKLWFAGGLFAVVISLITSFKVAMIAFIVITFIIIIIPVVYSYKIFKNTRHPKNNNSLT